MITGFWSVEETQKFKDDLREIFGKVQPHPAYLQDLLEATYFALERDPYHTGSPIMNTKYRVVGWSPPFLDRTVNIFFDIVGRRVRLLGANLKAIAPNP